MLSALCILYDCCTKKSYGALRNVNNHTDDDNNNNSVDNDNNNSNNNSNDNNIKRAPARPPSSSAAPCGPMESEPPTPTRAPDNQFVNVRLGK